METEKPAKKTPRSSKPLCLTNMAAKILSILKQKGDTTFQEVADDIVSDIGPDVADANNERTLRRRVYDVLNVFAAAGFITKDNKKITYTPPKTTQGQPLETSNLEEKIQAKQTALVDKIRMLLMWKLLIERNRQISRPAGTVPIDNTLFVGFKQCAGGTCNRHLDGRQLEIGAESTPLFYSPMNVMESVGFKREDEARTMAQFHEISPMMPVMYPEFSTH